jgi:Xaa-Pro aminopeptidase
MPPAPDEVALRMGRLKRLREEMRRAEIPAVVLFDPHNVRYATGARNMLPYLLRNPARYVFVPQEGPVILFEFEGAEHLEANNPAIDEIRPAKFVAYVARGPLMGLAAERWAAEIADLMAEHCPGERRIGVERIDTLAMHCLRGNGLELVDAGHPVELARAVKTPEEIVCSWRSIGCVQEGEWKLRQAIRPGITENELWSILHQHIIANDGDYIETRLLNSGEKTNPWYQETGDRKIGEGELIAHDTDVVGPHGYYADFSRTFLCGSKPPSEDQKTVYRLAHEQIQHNIELIKPGLTFREITEAGWKIPNAYYKRRYYLMMHGTGLTGEYPYIVNDAVYDGETNYDGIVEPNMTLCVESFIGHESGGEGVKLEQQVVVTETGYELMSTFPFEDDLLGREI